MRTEKKHRLGQLRHWRIRKKIVGTKERPRMSVCFSNENIHVQFIDDTAGVTLASASTVNKTMPNRDNKTMPNRDNKTMPNRDKLAANVTSAKTVGAKAAEAAQSKGIKQVVFDRGTARFHGKVKALADAAREAGLQF